MKTIEKGAKLNWKSSTAQGLCNENTELGLTEIGNDILYAVLRPVFLNGISIPRSPLEIPL